jgi:hypothetical protein
MRALLRVVLLAGIPAVAWAQLPAGTEFRVNTYTTGDQFSPAIAADGSGNFVVVWGSFGQDASSNAVFGQRFSASGGPQGGEFRVNSYTTGYQGRPAVASDANGRFVVVWRSGGQDGSDYGIFGQRFSASGAPLGSEFQVNTYTTGYQSQTVVASDASGNFVVVWMSTGEDGSGSGIFGQRFDVSGTAAGSEFRVNSYTTGAQVQPAVASDAGGDFVVVWVSAGQDGNGTGIFGRRFSASGVPEGGEFQVNAYTTGFQSFPAVSSDANGDFVVAWHGNYADGSAYGVFGRRFDASGASQGGDFQINSYTTGTQYFPAVTSDGGGNFVVVWGSPGQDGSNDGVFGQRFDASGLRLGTEFRVNSYTTSAQGNPAVASSPDGDFAVVWPSFTQDGSGSGVFGQRYGDLIFEDGFESGDLRRWSSAVTDGADLAVGGPAAMAGTNVGLLAFVNDTNSLFVQYDDPAGENRYRARFYFDPNGFDPGEAQSHFRTRVFIAFDNFGVRVITLVLKRQGGAYSLEGRVRLDDGTRADTGFLPITDGQHFFEFDWIRSAGPGLANGQFTLRIDDTLVSTLIDLNNDANPVGFVRMGALSIKSGASGTLYYDQFESRRQLLIGPE